MLSPAEARAYVKQLDETGRMLEQFLIDAALLVPQHRLRAFHGGVADLVGAMLKTYARSHLAGRLYGSVLPNSERPRKRPAARPFSISRWRTDS